MIKIKSFSGFLTEAKDQLDISIKAVGKYVTNDKKRADFLSDKCVVEHKTDGIKITLIYVGDTGDWKTDWIVSYKGEVQYPGEFDFAADSSIKKSSIANAQFQIIFNHLEQVGPVSGIPDSTEFFIEFLMRKPTLSSSYKEQHGMVLIAFSKTSYTVKMGKLKSSPSAFNTEGRDVYAKIIGLDVPAVLFEGVLGNPATFEKSIKMKELKSIYMQRKSSINWTNRELLVEDLREMFLEVDSVYGGKEEGCVLDFKNGIILKFQQEYQVSPEARKAIKAKYNEGDDDKNNLYWNQVRMVALEIIMRITVKPITEKDFPKFLKKAAKELKDTTIRFKHSKRDNLMIKDDIQGQIKLNIRKRLSGNNGALILGRFQPLTLGHIKMLEQANKQSDKLVICIVRARKQDLVKNPFPFDLQEKMIKDIFPKAEIITHSTGNIFGIMAKAHSNINTIWAGSDRVSDYKHTIRFNNELSVAEIKRTDEDISATKVRQSLIDDDEKTFKKMMHKKHHKYYTELRNIIN